ncbi:MAG: glycine cleavage system aminomethyltransferase GcvT [Myxococcota bacterium]
MTASRTTALHGQHLALGARMMPFAGYDMPVQYDGILAEHERVRKHVGLFDVSHMGEVRFKGPDALSAVNGLITNDIMRIGNGRAQYTCTCAPDGTIVDDLIVYRIADDEVLICVNASNRATDVAHFNTYVQGDVTITDESDSWAQIAVQGPSAPTLIGRLFGDELAALRPFRVRSAEFGGVQVLFSTTGYTGEAGGEIYVPVAQAEELWLALMAQGADLEVGPAGLGARDTLRLESAYCLYGNDIDRTTTPLEAGLSWVTRLGKDAFIGKDAIVAQKEAGVPRKLVGVEMVDRGIPRHDYPILIDGEVVGKITSGTKSPTTGKAIGLAYVPLSASAAGTPITVDCRGRMRGAVVADTPFYSRPKGD